MEVVDGPVSDISAVTVVGAAGSNDSTAVVSGVVDEATDSDVQVGTAVGIGSGVAVAHELSVELDASTEVDSAAVVGFSMEMDVSIVVDTTSFVVV